MTNKKHDLTRIEDLGEFLHELQEDTSMPDFEMGESSDSTSTALPEEEAPFATFEDEEVPLFTEESGEDSSEDEESIFDSTVITDSPSFPPIEDTTDFNFSEDEPFQPFDEPTPKEDPFFAKEVESYKKPETFEDLKQFAESTSFTGMGVEGNPSFSVLLKNVRFIEDVNDIIILLNDLKLMSDSEEQVRSRLSRGTFLVPRISEFAAIYLAHKLRRFDIDIQIGLSDEIHPPKHKEKPETGLVSKFNLYQNQTHHFSFEDQKLDLSQIVVAAASTLEGFQIVKYLGVATEHKMIDAQQVEDETSTEVPLHYKELAHKLKAHALKVSANAVVGLNYQLTPIPSDYGTSSSKYRLTCTGNLVWINKQ